MKDAIQELVKEMYQERDHEDLYQMETTRVSVSMPIADSILFDVIAKHFGTNRSKLLTECLDIVAQNLFIALDSQDKKIIGAETDDLTLKALKSIHDVYEQNGHGKWGSAAFVQTTPLEELKQESK